MSLLQLLVGPIASGKSTYCKSAAKHDKIIVNDDAIVTALHGGDYKLYNESLKPLYKTTENSIIQSALTLGRDVVIDRPNYSSTMRKRYIGIAKSMDVMVHIIMFKQEDPEIHARRRFNSDSRGLSEYYWREVARRHRELYEPPDADIEHFDGMFYWTWPGNLTTTFSTN